MIPNGTTKRKIFMASAELFGLYSYPRVSMRDIAAKVGIRAASIYNHYTTKDEILSDLLTYYVNTALRFIEKTEKNMSLPDYAPRLSDVVYVYEKEESQLMYWITRIIMTEQFTSPLAADVLLGSSFGRYSDGHRKFFDILADRGIITNKENCFLYAEIFSRIGHSYQLDFVHQEFTPTGSMMQMMVFLLKLILHYEGTADKLEEIL